MHFEATSFLLAAIQPYIENVVVNITSKNKRWRNRSHPSDLVNIDAGNHIGFEVFENDIIVFYFTVRRHFKNYLSKLQTGENPYEDE